MQETKYISVVYTYYRIKQVCQHARGGKTMVRITHTCLALLLTKAPAFFERSVVEEGFSASRAGAVHRRASGRRVGAGRHAVAVGQVVHVGGGGSRTLWIGSVNGCG